MPFDAETTTTPAEALTAVREYFLLLTADRAEFKDWAGGVVGGGPNNDGDYPLTDFTGNVHLVPCPAKIAATVELTMDDLVSRGQATLVALEATPGVAGQLAAVEGDGLYWFHPVDLTWQKLSDFPLQVSTDASMAADSDTLVPSQKAVKAAISSALIGHMEIMGGIDCSASPNYPAALRGDTYVVTVEGLIGGPLGLTVSVGTLLIAKDDNAGGNQGTAGVDWFVIGNTALLELEGGGSTYSGVSPSVVIDGNTNFLIAGNSTLYHRFTHGAAKTLTVRTDLSHPLPENGEWHLQNEGDGNLTIAKSAGVTIRVPPGGSLIIPPNGTATLKRVGEDVFNLFGATLTGPGTGEAFEDTDDQTAAQVPVTPAGNITSNNVQDALEELDALVSTSGGGGSGGSGGGGGGGLAGLTVIRRTTGQAIPSGTWTAIVFTDESYDNLGAFTPGGSTWTVPAGVSWMRCSFKTAWQNSGTGTGRYVLIQRASGTGTQYVAGDIRPPVNESFQSIESGWVPVVPGSTYRINVNTNAAAINLGDAFGGYPELTIEWAADLNDLLTGSAGARTPVISEAGTAVNLLNDNNGKYQRFTAVTAKVLTVRPNATHALTQDGEWHIRNAGAADLTITAGAGVTIHAPGGGTLVVPLHGSVTLKRVAVDEFDLIGQTVPA